MDTICLNKTCASWRPQGCRLFAGLSVKLCRDARLVTVRRRSSDNRNTTKESK